MATKTASRNGDTALVKERTLCWCGCGEQVAEGADFRSGHDVKAALAAITVDYGTVQEFIEAHGYDPDSASLMTTYHQHMAKSIAIKARSTRPAFLRR